MARKTRLVVYSRRSAARSAPRRSAATARHRLRRGLALGSGVFLLTPLGVAGSAAYPPVADPQHHQQEAPQAWALLDFPPPPAGIGVPGGLPQEPAPSPVEVREAQDPPVLVSQLGLPDGVLGRLGIPAIVLDAYVRAQNILATEKPGCHLPWWLLAGIGQVESGQADGGQVNSAGTTLFPILGPPLDGTDGNAAIRNTGNPWDGNSYWVRAVGPMQFLPSTWEVWGDGGNPNNIYDAALAAGRYLCAGDRDLAVSSQLVAAVFSYNPSDSYVELVLSWAYAYERGVVAQPARKTSGKSKPGASPSPPAVPGASPSPSPSGSPSPTPSASPSPSTSPSPTNSPSPTDSPTPTDSPSDSSSPSASS